MGVGCGVWGVGWGVGRGAWGGGVVVWWCGVGWCGGVVWGVCGGVGVLVPSRAFRWFKFVCRWEEDSRAA